MADEIDRANDIANDEKWIIASYMQLHEGKVGMHWLWAAIERLNAGDDEVQIMADFGYVPDSTPGPAPEALDFLDAVRAAEDADEQRFAKVGADGTPMSLLFGCCRDDDDERPNEMCTPSGASTEL